MKEKKILLLSVVLISVFGIILLSYVQSDAEEKEKGTEVTVPPDIGAYYKLKAMPKGVHVLGVKDPDGDKAVWAASPYGAKKVGPILAGYPSEVIEGLRFYSISSWKDTSKVIRAAYEDRDLMLWTLYKELSRLKYRVISLEKKLSELSK